MLSDRQIAEAILLRFPEGAERFEIACTRSPTLGTYWSVTALLGDGGGVTEVDAALPAALAKCNLSLLRLKQKESTE